jgi:hypothetical protein
VRVHRFASSPTRNASASTESATTLQPRAPTASDTPARTGHASCSMHHQEACGRLSESSWAPRPSVSPTVTTSCGGIAAWGSVALEDARLYLGMREQPHCAFFPKWGSHDLSRTSARNRFGHRRDVQGGVRRQTAAGRGVRAGPSRRNRTNGVGKGRRSTSRESNRGQRQGVVRNDHRLADGEKLNVAGVRGWIPSRKLIT